MKLNDDLIERVRNSVNLVDLVANYVQLRKRGQNHWALCPFHSEKTASFSVSESKQIFKCFGCGEGGDVFRFLGQIENLSFPEAVRHLAERNGIPLPEAQSGEGKQDETRGRLLEMMARAQDFFVSSLAGHEGAKAYLCNRKIERSLIEDFGLGFAPAGSRLLELLNKQGFSDEEMSRGGLIRESSEGDHYAKFRNRITFPIMNLSGQIIAFGGRILGEGQPKYLNSPDTPLYKKGHHLYALNIARQGIRQKEFSILVEGYFDCIVPYQFGISNVVASLGTGLTRDQARLLGRYARKVVLNFDPDAAGVAAAMRSIDLFLAEGFRVNVLQLPAGEDPDSFLLKGGAQKYLELLKESAPFLDFLLTQFMAGQRDPFSPGGKRDIFSQLLPYLLKVPDRIERSEYVSRVASRLRLDESLLIREMRRNSRFDGKQARLVPEIHREATLAEGILLGAVLEEDLIQDVFSRLDESLVEGLVTEKIFLAALGLWKRNQEINVIKLRERLEGEDQELLDRLTMGLQVVPVSRDSVFSSLEALGDVQLDRLSRQVQEEIAREEKEGKDSSRLAELLKKKESLRRQRAL